MTAGIWRPSSTRQGGSKSRQLLLRAASLPPQHVPLHPPPPQRRHLVLQHNRGRPPLSLLGQSPTPPQLRWSLPVAQSGSGGAAGAANAANASKASALASAIPMRRAMAPRMSPPQLPPRCQRGDSPSAEPPLPTPGPCSVPLRHHRGRHAAVRAAERTPTAGTHNTLRHPFNGFANAPRVRLRAPSSWARGHSNPVRTQTVR